MTIEKNQQEHGDNMKAIRDAGGNVIGYENEPNSRRRELRSKSNGLLAWYDKNTNRTFDRTGKGVGYGDQTARFLPRDDE